MLCHAMAPKIYSLLTNPIEHSHRLLRPPMRRPCLPNHPRDHPRHQICIATPLLCVQAILSCAMKQLVSTGAPMDSRQSAWSRSPRLKEQKRACPNCFSVSSNIRNQSVINHQCLCPHPFPLPLPLFAAANASRLICPSNRSIRAEVIESNSGLGPYLRISPRCEYTSAAWCQRFSLGVSALIFSQSPYMSSLSMYGCRKQPNECTAWAKPIMAQQCQCVLSLDSTPFSMSCLWAAPRRREPMKVRQKYQYSRESVLEATHPAAPPASRLLNPSSFSRMRRRLQRTSFSTSTIAGRNSAIVKYYRRRLPRAKAGLLAKVRSVRISCSARLITSPYLRFLKACLRAEMMQPQPWVQKGVWDSTSSSMKFILSNIMMHNRMLHSRQIVRNPLTRQQSKPYSPIIKTSATLINPSHRQSKIPPVMRRC